MGNFLNIALPKGRLGDQSYSLLKAAGLDCPELEEGGRKLVFTNPESLVCYFWVKPSDVPIYVARGVADLGIAGKDILNEFQPDVYELMDLGIGKCRMAVAAPEGFEDDHKGILRVASKFSRCAAAWYEAKARDIDIIHLNGSVEIAPVLGLSDVIVDIVETGTTLKENGLVVVEEVFPVSARLIANKAGYKFKEQKIRELCETLSKQLS